MINNDGYEGTKVTSLQKINDIFTKIETKIKIPRKNVTLIYLIFLLLIWFGMFDVYISYFITTFYPIKWSLQEIERKDKKKYRQWLSYWVIFSIFVLIDMFSESLKIIIPFYFIIRTVILTWCYCPGIKGASVINKIAFLQLARLSQKYKFYKVNKKDTLKAEVEETLENYEKEYDFLPNNSDKSINKKNN